MLELVPETWLKEQSDPDDRNHDGISGRVNRVWDVKRKVESSGRFGWKAEQPTVEQQAAGAFFGDMGITSSLFPFGNHGHAQATKVVDAGGASPEVSDAILADVVFYARVLAVPARRNVHEPSVHQGEQLFSQLECSSCHVPSVRVGKSAELPMMSQERIHPYSDLLLHDMGEGLSDHRPSFSAQGSEWRTPPLWGIGLVKKVNGHTFLMHDGRARNLTEAVLWHGGEASRAQAAFRNLSATERQALIAFLESL